MMYSNCKDIMETPANEVGFLKQGGLWVLAQAILLVAIVVWHVTPFASPANPIPYFGPLFLALGLGTIVASCLKLGKNLTPMPSPKSDAHLETTGIYSLIRHPIYAGLIFVAIAFYAMFPSFGQAYITVATMAFFGAKATREERWLRQKFPDYVEYMDRSWRFIPFFS